MVVPTSHPRPAQTVSHGVGGRAGQNGTGVFLRSYFMQAEFTTYKFISPLQQFFEEGNTMALLHVRKLSPRENNVYKSCRACLAGCKHRSPCLLTWLSCSFLPSTILTIRCSVTPEPSDLVQITSVFSLNSELTLPSPVPCRKPVTFRKQVMETFEDTEFIGKGQNYISLVCLFSHRQSKRCT